MSRRRFLEFLVLGLVAACVLAGGGLGCKPELDGVKFRPVGLPLVPDDKDSPLDWYGSFEGKKEPGNAWLALPYPLVPPYGVSARVGVFDLDRVLDSEDAEGCIWFQRSDRLEELSLCVSYSLPAAANVYSSADANTFSCTGATKAELDLDDDGNTATLRYRCPGDPSFSTLTTADSLFDVGETWYAGVGAYAVRKGGEVGFDDFRISTAPPATPTPEQVVGHQTFEGFRLSLEAFYELESFDLPGAQIALNQALGFTSAAEGFIENGAASFADPAAFKFLVKTNKALFKSSDSFFDGKEDKYFKAFPKIAGSEACALEAMGPGL